MGIHQKTNDASLKRNRHSLFLFLRSYRQCYHKTLITLINLFCLILLPVAPAYSEIVLDKNAPGVGVVKPSEWMKDYLENQLKDAAFGSEVDAGMDVIFQKTYDKFIALSKRDRSLRRCKGAAFTQAFNVAGELHNARVLRGFGEMFWDIEKNLITLGGGTIAEFLKKKSEEQVRKAVRNAMKNQQTVVYENTYSFDGGEQAVKAVWNKAAGSYTIYITGNSFCKEVRDQWIGGRKIRLAEWTVVARGSARVVPNKNKTGLKVIASQPRLSISANCNCTKDGTRIPPPPPEEDDDETEEEDDEDKEEDPIKLGLEEGNVFKDALQCPACSDKHAELDRLAGQTRTLAGRMNRLARAINDEPYKTKQRDKDHADWLKNRSKLLDTQEKFNKLYVAYVKCEETECKKTGSIYVPIRDSRRTYSTTCEKCNPVVADLNKTIEKYNAHVQDMNGTALAANKLEFGTLDGNKLYRIWQNKEAERKKILAVINAGIKLKNICEATNCFGRKPFSKVEYSKACPACSGVLKRVNDAEKEYNAIIDQINADDQKFREFLQAGGDVSTKRGSELSSASIRKFRKMNELWDKLDKLRTELRKCDPSQCGSATTDETRIRISEDIKTEPVGRDGGAKVPPPPPSESVIDELSTSPGGIYAMVSTDCKPCQRYTRPINKAIQTAMDLEWQWYDLAKNGPKQISDKVKQTEQKLDKEISDAKGVMDQRAADLRTARGNLLDKPGDAQLIKAEKAANDAFRDARTKVEQLQRAKPGKIKKLTQQLVQELQSKIAKLKKERDDLVELIKDLKAKLKACEIKECPEEAKKKYKLGDDFTPLRPTGDGDKKIRIGEDGQPVKPDDEDKKTDESRPPTSPDQKSEGTKVGSNCIGSGCFDEFTVLCTGSSCPDTFTLTCTSNECPDLIQLDCIGDTCLDSGSYDCGAGGCPVIVDVVCLDSNQCTDVSTPEPLTDNINKLADELIEFGFDDAGFLPLDSDSLPPLDLPVFDNEGTFQGTLEYIMLEDLLNNRPDFLVLFDPVTGVDETDTTPVTSTNDLLGGLLDFTLDDDPGTYFIVVDSFSGRNDFTYTLDVDTVPIDVNCTGGGCPDEPVTGVCLGSNCPDSVDLSCPDSGCAEAVEIRCSDGECTDADFYSFTVNTDSIVSTLISDCGEAGCAVNESETLELATEPGTYFIVVDSFSGSGDYELTIDVNCTGGGCPDVPIAGSCTGETCPESLSVICGDSLCPEQLNLDCSTSPCPDDVSIDCDALGCFAQQIDFSFDPEEPGDCVGASCPDEAETTSSLEGVEFVEGYNSLGESRFGVYRKIIRKVSTSCEPCQPIVDQINEVVDILNDLDKEFETAQENVRNATGDDASPDGAAWTEWRRVRNEGAANIRIVKQLMERLKECVKQCDETDRTILIGENFVLTPGPGYTVDWAATTGFGPGTASPASGIPVDGSSQVLTKLPPSDCPPCDVYVNSYNQTIDEITALQSQLRAEVRNQSETQKTMGSLSGTLDSLEGMDQATFENQFLDEDLMPESTTVDSYRQEVQGDFNKTAARLLDIAATIEDLKQKIKNKQDFLGAIKLSLTACEQQCARVIILNVINLFGNFPYNRLDPLSQEGSSASEPTVLVVNNIPIIRLSLAGPDACPESHYHGDANNCNGVFTVDPAPFVCGQGTVSQVIAIPVSACPDL